MIVFELVGTVLNALIKAQLRIKDEINLKNYKMLSAFLKGQEESKSKQSKVISI